MSHPADSLNTFGASLCRIDVRFGLEHSGAALLEIVLWWCAIAATAVVFWRMTVTAGLLFVPYLGEGTFAMMLNSSMKYMTLATYTREQYK